MILVVEDNRDSRSAIFRDLDEAGYDVDVCGDVSNISDTIRGKGIRIVVINGAAENDSTDICREIRESKYKKYVYIIVISGKGDEKVINEIFDAGADDYISNQYNREQLILRIKVGMRMLELEDKLVNTRRELIRVAREDPLTGLLNRRAFLDEAINELERSTREHHIVSSVMIEIDNYNELVEKHGFEARDGMLVEVAVRLQSSCRSYDKIARYGGGVFIMLLPNTRKKTALKIAKRMQSELSGRPFYLMGESETVTACFGVSLIAPDLGLKDSQLDELVKKTGMALKAAQKQGPNKIAVSADA